jgi:hypothetical protein
MVCGEIIITKDGGDGEEGREIISRRCWGEEGIALNEAAQR